MFRHAFFLIGIVMLAQCDKEPALNARISLEKYTYHQPIMGTRFSIVLFADNKEKADTAARAAFKYAEEVNRTCSDYDGTSELMQLNAASTNKPFSCSPMLFNVLNSALHIAEQTNGAYDPTLGWHCLNWRIAREKNSLPTNESIAVAKATSGWKKLKLDPQSRAVTKLVDNMRLDLGGIAKGYAADGMLSIFKDRGINRVSIIAGGEVLLGDPPPNKDGWKVTLKTLDTNYTITPKTLIKSNCAISTSGDLHQSITIADKRYSHVVSPTTGLGLTQRISATVITDKAIMTDAMSTAFCVNPQLPHRGLMTIIVFENSAGSLEAIVNNK